MRIPNQVVEKLLLASETSDEATLKDLKNKANSKNLSLMDLVIENSVISHSELAKLYADYVQMDFVEIDPKTITIEALTTTNQSGTIVPVTALRHPPTAAAGKARAVTASKT